MFLNISESEILKESKLNNIFKSAFLKDININCKILDTDFYLDSYNYFPITKNNETFLKLFKRHEEVSLNHFYTEKFYQNFINNKNNFKTIKNGFVLGSSPADNYFSNLIFFFPRIFFINQKKINIIIHRNLSNKFRNLIKSICEMRGVQISFSFIDDDFYKFDNCLIPQFLDIYQSISALKFFLNKTLTNINVPKFRSKIYIRREDANYRKILNEADLIDKLRNHGFEIVNPQHFEILEQLKIFSNAKLIVSPHGSNLSNIIFCQKGTKIIEIGPDFDNKYEKNFLDRYKNLSLINDLDHSKIIADTVDISKHSEIANKYINSNILNNSNYYKNMILKVSEIDKLINSL